MVEGYIANSRPLHEGRVHCLQPKSKKSSIQESDNEKSINDLSSPAYQVEPTQPASQLTLFSLTWYNTEDYIEKENILTNELFTSNERNYPLFDHEPETRAAKAASAPVESKLPAQESKDTSVMKMMLSSKLILKYCAFVL